MKIKFSVNYRTFRGMKLVVAGNIKKLGNWNIADALNMQYEDNDNWVCEISLTKRELNSLEYKYVLVNEDNSNTKWEFGKNRLYDSNIICPDFIYLSDKWRVKNNSYDVLQSSAFTDVIFKRKIDKQKTELIKKLKTSKMITFNINVPKISIDHKVCILGNSMELGKWDKAKLKLMDEVSHANWQITLETKNTKTPISYKYGIYDTKTKELLTFESGDNRVFDCSDIKETSINIVDEVFNYSNLEWHGTGVAIPVFSLRSKTSMGAGEFKDIKLLVDWCKRVGINMIQLLPVNDTVSSHTWMDSYPYSGISVTALHPLYLNLDSLGELPFGVTNEILRERAQLLNSYETVDYESVMNLKSRIYKMAYDIHKNEFLKSREFKKFFDDNRDWLSSYAAFSFLRDLYGTAVFAKWGEKYSKYDVNIINELVDPSSEHYDEIAIHYYIQYHLHKQLLEVSEYARSMGVLLKGDIPIGVNRNGVDAWANPDLFNMDSQTGAPPDDYAEDGQNWGFPTYNWEEMAKDGYRWWKNRLKHLSQYFDAYRIDHILGFFRIWEIPYDAVSGLLGHFSPAHPITKDEFYANGIDFDEDVFCKSQITQEVVYNLFGNEALSVISTYLDDIGYGKFDLKPEFATQRLIDEYFKISSDFTAQERMEITQLKKKLSQLLNNRMFFEDKEMKENYHPRIELKKTSAYKKLDHYKQEKIQELYLDYYYNRQETLWKEQAMIKLPALTGATNMLVCGEDLGMVPECVPGVMDELGLLSLRIQRMPKDEKLTFGIPSQYPYMSVCSPSCHDMSTIRGWWEEDRELAQKYYNEILGQYGEAPYYCEPWVCEEIIKDHLNSPSMWAVFPIQDLLGINGELRKENPSDERINVPSIPKHYWKYRFHMDMEDLLKENDFNDHLKDIIQNSGRNIVEY
ncbi:MAG TPA: 4-alpha-glucanotransferase [Victivallales bacterium]|nr:4-alpha-glucanotransferase [Victivallales bacterium]